MRVGVVLVHFHTPRLVASALAALAVSASAAGIELAVVVVDNGSTPAEREEIAALRGRLAFQLLEPGANLGYAGGLNAGVASLPPCEAYALMNPDVLVEEGCLGTLAAALRDGIGIVGPRFYWDTIGGIQLPPTECMTFRDEAARILAPRGGRWLERARARWRRHAYPYFQAETTVPSIDLSGALLLASAEAWRRVGPFDDGFRLYFEENDWLRRARNAGVGTFFVPQAAALHLYAQSPLSAEGQAWFAASQQQYRRKHLGALSASLLAALARRQPACEPPAVEPSAVSETWPADPAVATLEISPSPLPFPAAVRCLPQGLPAGEPLLPSALVPRLAKGRYWLRALDAEGQERHARVVAIG